ncbi:MAG: CPBP family intramembrane metalloprotease, partial [Odoribacter sp.]|nr:CPBP family intramembrane metalloprotease [Odoribacter sp.]
MPGVSALLLVEFLYKQKGINHILKQLAFTARNIKWYLFALLIPVISLLIVFLIINNSGKFPALTITINYTWYEYILMFCFILLGSLGEEIGWRGYLLPKLMQKYSLLQSSIIIGFVWGIWHFMVDSGLLTFFIYLIFSIQTSIIISWIYHKAKKSLITAIIYHTSVNMSAFILFENLFIEANNNLMGIVFGINCILLLIPLLLIRYINIKKKLLPTFYFLINKGKFD